MSEANIQAEIRNEFGKGAARRIRREDKIPAVIYGHGNDPLHITLPGHQTMMAIRHLGANALLELEIDGKQQLALTKAVQVDPIRRLIEHIDFVSVRKGEKVSVDVPVHTVGDAAPETLVTLENDTVLLEAEATHIPEYIEVSIEGAEAGTQILASALDLPKGSVLQSDPELLVVHVAQAPSQADIEAELEEAEAEAGIEKDESEDEAAEGEAPEAAAEEGGSEE
jgi:large subunit ribosomal protein L25